MVGDNAVMMQEVNKKDLRQFAYRERAIRAKTYARVLLPVAMFAIGTSAWTDPDLGPQLVEGLEEIRPIAATYLVDTPFEDMLGPVPEPVVEAAAEDLEGDQLTASADMPDDQVPVNRP